MMNQQGKEKLSLFHYHRCIVVPFGGLNPSLNSHRFSSFPIWPDIFVDGPFSFVLSLTVYATVDRDGHSGESLAFKLHDVFSFFSLHDQAEK